MTSLWIKSRTPQAMSRTIKRGYAQPHSACEALLAVLNHAKTSRAGTTISIGAKGSCEPVYGHKQRTCAGAQSCTGTNRVKNREWRTHAGATQAAIAKQQRQAWHGRELGKEAGRVWFPVTTSCSTAEVFLPLAGQHPRRAQQRLGLVALALHHSELVVQCRRPLGPIRGRLDRRRGLVELALRLIELNALRDKQLTSLAFVLWSSTVACQPGSRMRIRRPPAHADVNP